MIDEIGLILAFAIAFFASGESMKKYNDYKHEQRRLELSQKEEYLEELKKELEMLQKKIEAEWKNPRFLHIASPITICR